MRPQAIRSPPTCPVLSAILLNAFWLSDMAIAHPDTHTSTDKTPSRIIRRATSSRRPTVTVTANANENASTGKKGLSLVVIIVIVVAVLVAILAIAGTAYWLYRGRSSKSRKTKALNLPSIDIGQHSSPRPLSTSAARREPDWWQPSTADGVDTVDLHDHTIVPYSQGGHGYTYGRTLDVPGAGTGNSVGHGHSSQVTQVTEQIPGSGSGGGRPFQIPVLAPPPPPSISPSYHTYAGQGERSFSDQNPRELDTIRSGHVYNPEPYTGTYSYAYTAPITNLPPPSSNSNSNSFQPRPAETTLAYLQPQATGTSIYSNPYETSAMTQSTSGHPGT